MPDVHFLETGIGRNAMATFSRALHQLVCQVDALEEIAAAEQTVAISGTGPHLEDLIKGRADWLAQLARAIDQSTQALNLLAPRAHRSAATEAALAEYGIFPSVPGPDECREKAGRLLAVAGLLVKLLGLVVDFSEREQAAVMTGLDWGDLDRCLARSIRQLEPLAQQLYGRTVQGGPSVGQGSPDAP